MPDLVGQRLVDASDFTSVDFGVISAFAPRLNSIVSTEDTYSKVLAEFQEIVQPTFKDSSVNHRIQHFIPTEGPPFIRKSTPITP